MEKVECPDLKILDQKNKKFRISNQRLLLIYESYLNKENVKAYFDSINLGDMKIFECVHIKKTKESYVVVDFGKTYASTDIYIFDFDNIHPIIKIIGSKLSFNRVLNYLSTIDDGCKHLKTKNNNILYQKPQDNTRMFRRWQKELFDICYNEIDVFRCDSMSNSSSEEFTFPEYDNGCQVIWIYNPRQGTGKTFFINNVLIHDNKKFFACDPEDFGEDPALLFENAIKRGWTGDTFIFDLTRYDIPKNVYHLVNKIGDGRLMNRSSDSFIFTCQHLIILSDEVPVLSDKNGTFKWVVYMVNPKSKRLQEIDYEIVNKIRKFRETIKNED